MPNKRSKNRSRFRTQRQREMKAQEQRKQELRAQEERLIASIDNNIPISAWLPQPSVRLRKALKHLPKRTPISKNDLKQKSK
jgi:hypothetical protein